MDARGERVTSKRKYRDRHSPRRRSRCGRTLDATATSQCIARRTIVEISFRFYASDMNWRARASLSSIPICARRYAKSNSSCTTSRRSRSRPGKLSVRRRCCAGSALGTASSVRASFWHGRRKTVLSFLSTNGYFARLAARQNRGSGVGTRRSASASTYRRSSSSSRTFRCWWRKCLPTPGSIRGCSIWS